MLREKTEKSDNIILQQVKIEVDLQKECRICLQNSLPLIVPCKCDGTVKYVHENCLKLWARQLVKKKLQKQIEDDSSDNIITYIDCELCKSKIELKIKWNWITMSFQQARQAAEQYFWPTFIIYIFIELACICCVVFIFTTLILVITNSPIVDFHQFADYPYLLWGILITAIIAGIAFAIKVLKDIHELFAKKQFEIQTVIINQANQQERSRNFNVQSNAIAKQPNEKSQITCENLKDGLNYIQTQLFGSKQETKNIQYSKPANLEPTLVLHQSI